jgi:hypothetical protein
MGIITLDVLARANRAPSSTGWLSVPLVYNQLYVFTLANFTTETSPAYADPDGDAFHSLKISSLPTQGTLVNNSVASTVGDVVTSADLSGGLFTYQADAADTDGYSDGFMKFTVSDVGSFLYTTSPKVVTIVVGTNENAAPSSVGNGEADVTVGSTLVFTRNMLTTQLNPPYEDPEGDIASMLLVVSVPSHGLLKLDGVTVVDNQEIDFTDIDSGLLSYVSNEYPSGGIEGFEFKISDVGSGLYVG